MIPGELLLDPGAHALNPGRRTLALVVRNASDRPIQVGSHYHFAETNAALDFDRKKAYGHRLAIAAGMAIRFEPGQHRDVPLIPFSGLRHIYGFRGEVMGPLDQGQNQNSDSGANS